MSRDVMFAAVRSSHGRFNVDTCMPAIEMTDQVAGRITLRQRLNPEIRHLLVPVPAGTTPDDWCAAFDALTHEEQRKLYVKGSP